jgi:hypothetical protein
MFGVDDIQVVFYHEEEGHVLWEGIGEFSASDVHKQVAITFRTPRYRVTDVSDLNYANVRPLVIWFYISGGGARKCVRSTTKTKRRGM